MPNWCYTSYVCVGNKKEVYDLYEKMLDLTERNTSLTVNDFGKEWVGNLIVRLGGNWKEISCRGEFGGLDFEDGILRFFIMSAWVELSDVRKFIESYYVNLKMYYYAEEPGCSYYITNDVMGYFFPDRYILGIKDDDDMYFEHLEDLFTAIETMTGLICKSEDDIERILDTGNGRLLSFNQIVVDHFNL